MSIILSHRYKIRTVEKRTRTDIIDQIAQSNCLISKVALNTWHAIYHDGNAQTTNSFATCNWTLNNNMVPINSFNPNFNFHLNSSRHISRPEVQSNDTNRFLVIVQAEQRGTLLVREEERELT